MHLAGGAPWRASAPVAVIRRVAALIAPMVVIIGLFGACCCATFCYGCVIQTQARAPASHLLYPVVAASEDETFAGTVDNNLAMGTAYVELEASGSDTRCRGEGHLIKPAADCAGGQGACSLQCEDGTTIQCRYQLRSCASGYGIGQSADRKWFAFSFGPGMSGLEGQEITAKLKTYIASLPSAASSKKRRGKSGFISGTGFFVSPDGYIVSAFHVVQGAHQIAVVLRSGDVLRAELRGEDEANDIALLKVKGRARPLPMGSSKEVAVGDQVFTIGYPLIDIEGQEQKTTFGRVNALSGIQDDVRFVQIDVPIQPGNSGGPVIDSRGDVVGIVVRTLDPAALLKDEGALPQNANYAVKSDYVLPLMIRYEVQPAGSHPITATRDSEMIKRLRDSVVLVIAR